MTKKLVNWLYKPNSLSSPQILSQTQI